MSERKHSQGVRARALDGTAKIIRHRAARYQIYQATLRDRDVLEEGGIASQCTKIIYWPPECPMFVTMRPHARLEERIREVLR